MSTTEADDSQDSVSMVEVLEDQQQIEEDAHAVLGGSDDNHCTYPQGALPRQALYSCATCVTSSQAPAGVCLACCLACHEGHNLYELYTKRNFRCDCGNSKFGSKKCKIWPSKASTNPDNSYNQNFQGLYCTCHRPYPDEEIDEEMIQCVVCEDWYHTGHLKSKVPDGQNYEEMICYLCAQKHSFLRYYKHLQVATKLLSPKKVSPVKKSEKGDVSIGSEPKQKVKDSVGSVPEQKVKDRVGSTPEQKVKYSVGSEPEQKLTDKADDKPKSEEKSDKDSEKPSTSRDTASDSPAVSGPVVFCLLDQLKESLVGGAEIEAGSLFWRKGWRNELCTCDKCMDVYTSSKLPYLLDDTDSIVRYEAAGRQDSAPSSQYERGMEALAGMNRTTQVEMISGYNDLKTELKDYLKKFADNGKVVKEEDIKEFFTGLASKKRQKTEIQYHCK